MSKPGWMSARFEKLIGMLIRHEGLALRIYTCPAGKPTIGVGRQLEDNGITVDEAMILLTNDIQRAVKVAKESFPWFEKLNEARQDVIISMIFNIGIGHFREFKKMIAALEAGDYALASAEMLESQWRLQVGSRAVELAENMKQGEATYQ